MSCICSTYEYNIWNRQQAIERTRHAGWTDRLTDRQSETNIPHQRLRKQTSYNPKHYFSLVGKVIVTWHSSNGCADNNCTNELYSPRTSWQSGSDKCWCYVTVETLYNTVNFCWNTHKRHSIARLKGRGMGCLLWVQRATYCVDLSKLSSIKYLL